MIGRTPGGRRVRTVVVAASSAIARATALAAALATALAIVLAFALVAAAVPACGRGEGDPGRAARAARPAGATPLAPPAVAPRGTPEVSPRWTARLPWDPDRPALRVEPPLLAGGALIAASTVAGYAGVDATTGALLWQAADALEVRRPVAAGGAVVLVRPCAAVAGGAGPGCADSIDPRTGRVLASRPIPSPSAPAGGAVLAEPLGAEGDAILVAAGLEVLLVPLADPAGAAGSLLRRPPPGPELPGPPEARAVLRLAGSTYALFPDGVAARSPGACGGFLPFEEPLLLGAAGPVIAGGVLVHGVDDALVASDPVAGVRLWAAAGRYAATPGALAPAPDGRSVRAVRLEAGTVARATVAVADGALVERGEAVAGGRVLAAAFAPGGDALAVAMASDQAEWVQAFGPDGRPAWRWPLPGLVGGVRTVRLLATGDATYAVVDGRLLVRLPAAGLAPARP